VEWWGGGDDVTAAVGEAGSGMGRMDEISTNDGLTIKGTGNAAVIIGRQQSFVP
jgi:hypothetical protein